MWSYITPNRGTIKRILDYVSYALASFIASFFHKADIIIATSPQLFTAVSGFMVSVVKNRPWIMEVRDLWPESIKAVDAMNTSSILNPIQKLVHFLYKSCTAMVVVTDSFKEIISAQGIPPEKISVVKNGVNQSRFNLSKIDHSIAEELDIEGKFVVGYIGTHGMAHNLDFILDCAKEVSQADIIFLLIGDGAMKNRLERRRAHENIINVRMLEAIPRDVVHQYISIIDLALIPLKKSETFQSVLPSKIFENAAMGKPILLGVEGEAQEMVSSYEAGLCFEPENKEDFIAKLELLYSDKELYQKLTVGGLALAKDYSRNRLASKMHQFIERVFIKDKIAKQQYTTIFGRTVFLRKRLGRALDFLLIFTIIIILYYLVLA